MQRAITWKEKTSAAIEKKTHIISFLWIFFFLFSYYISPILAYICFLVLLVAHLYLYCSHRTIILRRKTDREREREEARYKGKNFSQLYYWMRHKCTRIKLKAHRKMRLSLFLSWRRDFSPKYHSISDIKFPFHISSLCIQMGLRRDILCYSRHFQEILMNIFGYRFLGTSGSIWTIPCQCENNRQRSDS